MNVVEFKRNEDPLELISKLTDLLERAKSGELESFIACVCRVDRRYFTTSSGYKNSLELIGALECAKKDLIEASER